MCVWGITPVVTWLDDMVSSASRAGSHHLAAMAAACSTLVRLCPGENVGQSACASIT